MNNETGGPAVANLSLREHAIKIKSEGVRCNCDLDKWEPEPTTGHTHVCRIHKAAMEKFYYPEARK